MAGNSNVLAPRRVLRAAYLQGRVPIPQFFTSMDTYHLSCHRQKICLLSVTATHIHGLTFLSAHAGPSPETVNVPHFINCHRESTLIGASANASPYHLALMKLPMMTPQVPTRRLNISSLPTELVLCVCDFLSPAQIICFALCNHRLMDMLSPNGPKSLDNRLPHGRPGDMANERSIFLNRLSKDLPQYYPCSICLRLHLWRTVKLPGARHNSDQELRPHKCFARAGNEHSWLQIPFKCRPLVSYTSYDFHFVHLQLIMRRLHYGPTYGLSPEAAFSTWISFHPFPDLGGSHFESFAPGPANEAFQKSHLTQISSVEARIHPDSLSLVLRIQNISMVPREFAPMLLPNGGSASYWVCCHTNTDSNPKILDLIKTHVDQWQANDFIRTITIYSVCHRLGCNTQYVIWLNLAEGSRYLTLTITSWTNLGTGLTPEDLPWKKAVLFKPDTGPWSHFCHPREQFEEAAVSQETGSNVSFWKRYQRNMAWLQDRRYEKMMRRATDNSWVTNRDYDFEKRDTDQCCCIS